MQQRQLVEAARARATQARDAARAMQLTQGAQAGQATQQAEAANQWAEVAADAAARGDTTGAIAATQAADTASAAVRGGIAEATRAHEAAVRATQAIQSGQKMQSRQGSEAAVARAVADASRRAAAAARAAQTGQYAQVSQFGEADGDVDDQEGGWLKGQSKTTKLKARLAKKLAAGKEVKGSVNANRSFKATVNGVPLKGVGSKGDTNRYFHGEPAAAARKVVAQLRKGHKLSKDGAYTIQPVDVDGINNAVVIKITEVTKGVTNHKGQQYTHEYFGWSEPLETPRTVTKQGANGPVTITVSRKNIAVPKSTHTNAAAAKAKSANKGAKIKSAKAAKAGQ